MLLNETNCRSSTTRYITEYLALNFQGFFILAFSLFFSLSFLSPTVGEGDYSKVCFFLHVASNTICHFKDNVCSLAMC